MNNFKQIRGILPSRYIKYELSDFMVNKFNLQNNTDPIHVPSKEVGLIWLEKMYLVQDAYNKNFYDTDWYCWIDAGICTYRETVPPKTILLPPSKEILLDKNKINYCKSEDLPDDYNNNKLTYNHTISGTTFIIHKDKINYFVDIFYKYLQECNKLTNDFICYSDQIIFTRMFFDNQEYFNKISNNYGDISGLF